MATPRKYVDGQDTLRDRAVTTSGDGDIFHQTLVPDVSGTPTEATGETVSGETGVHVAPIANAALGRLALGVLDVTPAQAQSNLGFTLTWGTSGTALAASATSDPVDLSATRGRLLSVYFASDDPSAVSVNIKADGQKMIVPTSPGAVSSAYTGSSASAALDPGTALGFARIVRFDTVTGRYSMAYDFTPVGGLPFTSSLLVRLTNTDGSNAHSCHCTATYLTTS